MNNIGVDIFIQYKHLYMHTKSFNIIGWHNKVQTNVSTVVLNRHGTSTHTDYENNDVINLIISYSENIIAAL